MGRRALDVLVAAFNDQEVAVLHAGVKVDAVVGQVLVQEFDEHVALLGFEATAGVVLQNVALDAYEVAAQRQVARLQFHADAGGLQRAAPLIDEVLVVAKDAAVGDLAAGMEAVGYGLQQAVAPVARQPVHSGRVGILQEGLTAQRWHMPIGHAVAQND